MSRLYDRVLAYGCRAFRPSDLDLRRGLRFRPSAELSSSSSHLICLRRRLSGPWRTSRRTRPRAVERFDPAEACGEQEPPASARLAAATGAPPLQRAASSHARATAASASGQDSVHDLRGAERHRLPIAMYATAPLSPLPAPSGGGDEQFGLLGVIERISEMKMTASAPSR